MKKKYICGLIAVVALVLVGCCFFSAPAFQGKSQPKIRGIIKYDNDDGKTVTTIITFETGETFKYIRNKPKAEE